MKVKKVKYVIWAADASRALKFYQDVFEGEITVETPYWNEVVVEGATIGIHPGGEAKGTWTGLSFQVDDIMAGIEAIKAAGGRLVRDPQEEDGSIHLANCADTENNEIMLTATRH